ncbi:hypothetical protein QEH52_19780 [Coraliomargarita sp. SDUM461003]|uniref:Seryl-tRNA synthetase n=1 Tax=Thalassobacterium maritimum TaxID=3041265 RepID=A0ABU1B233_9BACT|nr:hypothetical protein [Coraliomargarita sp. SDUM461003]MDQ8209769.1 hypothetical protein [Coraliomargarita sp. SDUM461003]
MKRNRQHYYFTAIICMVVLSFAQLFLNLNDGWKEQGITEIQEKVAQVESKIKELSPQEAQVSVNQLNEELSSLRNREKIYDTFIAMAGILMMPCALGVIYFRPRLNQTS